MSQSGYTPIQLYRTTTAAATPTAGNLAAGELAINLTDEKLYFKNAGGTVKLLASTDTLGTVTSVAASGGTTGLTFSGSPITTSGTLTLGGTLTVANGGTGATSLTSGYLVKGNGTSAVSASVVYDDGTNVGVGDPSPAYKLTVAGDLRLTGGGDLRISSATGTTTSGGDSQIYNDANNMIFTTGTTAAERMRLDSTGQLGIGCTPGYRLDVAAGDTTAGLGYAVRLRSNATAAAAAIQFTDSPVNTQNGLIACTDTGILTLQGGDGGSAAVAFRTGGDERFKINNTGGITSSALADAVGYKGLPQNSQTSSYTLALSDMGKHISITTGGVVIPANASVAFPIGATIVVFNNSGSTQTISITSDTLRQAGTTNTGSRTLAVYGLATLVKVTSTVWAITGNVT